MKMKTELIALINEAVKMNASDIHFNLEDPKVVLVSYRAGNVMMPHMRLERKHYEKLLAFIKFNSSLDLVSPMQPQSGSLTIEKDDELLSCRVSILPTAKFQSLVLRIINRQLGYALDDLPFFPENIATLKKIANKQSGLILIGSPTSGGKTTTAYSFIEHLKNTLGKSVITIEDPIEYQQPVIIEKRIKPEIKMRVEESKPKDAPTISESESRYDVGIKEILRHDPDVIVIGEIRDANTAKNAIRAALTGHLVISTIHSKDVLGMIHRLLDLGISTYDIEQSVVALINQRLVPAGNAKRVLMEICTDNILTELLKQVEEGKILTIPYTSIDEEFLKWKAQTG